MNQLGFPILSFLIFFPLAAVLILLFVDRKSHGVLRGITLGTALINFLVSLMLFFTFHLDTPQMQFVEKFAWIPDYGISYFVGIDGISLLLVLLTTFFTPICVLACWKDIQQWVKGFMICLLFLETGMIGVFVSLDLFLFYVFWEVMLIPMYLLIGIWGNPARRVYAAVKFFLYTMAGSLLMLVAILVVYFMYFNVTKQYSFDLLELYKLAIPPTKQTWLFLAFSLAFAIKVPMFPFHTWLPDAHTEAPTVGSVLLAAVLLKMGTYGFLRFCLPLFPNAAMEFVPLISILAIIGIIYGAMVSMVQPDLKRLVAFSSVSHLGFVMLGIFAMNIQAVEGSIIQMINHGLSTGALFLIVGIIYERRHTRMIADFGGLCRVMPGFAAIFMIVTLSSIGLPGLNGFVGEFLILVGTFLVNKTYAVIAATGVILAACYMLWMYQRVIFGPVTNSKNQGLKDLSVREYVVLVPVVLFIIWIGVYPSPFLRTMDASVNNLLAVVKQKARIVEEMTSPGTEERLVRMIGSSMQMQK
ncbi:MAG: NADH-quinone oxidoreductase subunit M [Deltaproteobacteria bacterium]|nr:NADH-quinone oxidoreductase subunit M [Deltaproteobacteria bacterium]